MQPQRGFGSDNNSGIHPAVLASIQAANVGHVPGYGDDPYTAEAVAKFRQLFGEDAEVFFTFGGTGANVVGLGSALDSYQAVICAHTAHINVDECGAPEKFTGCKLMDLPTLDGKLTMAMIATQLHGRGDVHTVQPRIVSITQPTELGTLYQVEEIRAIAEFAHTHDLLLHMDGARISNAAAALNMPVRAFTRDAGVDILSFGGTKNGLMCGEAVLIFRPELALRLPFLRKQGMQLASKMRFIAAQFNALLTDDLWLRNAQHANQMARRLAQAVSCIPGLALAQKSEANAVFVQMPQPALARVQERYFFYLSEESGAARWMTSFDTTEEDIEGLIEVVKEAMRE